MLAATREAQAFAAHYSDEVLELRATVETLRTALLDANQICRSAFQIAHRIATEYSTNEMGTYFGAFSERAYESLKRQHVVIQRTGGYPLPEGPNDQLGPGSEARQCNRTRTKRRG